MPMLEYDVIRIEIDNVDLSKSITNPFDPLLIVWDPYNSRIIKELHYIAIEKPYFSVCSFGGHHSTTLTSKELIPLTRAFHLILKLKFLLGSS